MSGAATLRRPPSNMQHPNQQQLQMQMQPHPMEQIPNANFMDNSMYDRDKQVYKCSTLRQGGKFDPRNFGNIRMPPIGPNDYTMNGNTQIVQQKPSILNCPLPEIPKEYSNGDPNAMESKYNGNNMTNQPTMTRWVNDKPYIYLFWYNSKDHDMYMNFFFFFCRTLQRPFKHLPPTGKAIPPPKISDTYQSKASLTASKAIPINGSAINGNLADNNSNIKNLLPPPSSPPLPPPPITKQHENISDAALPAPPPSSNITQNDESNYAVTEL